MAYGFEIVNSDGELVLDGNTPVYTEVMSGNLTVNNQDWSGTSSNGDPSFRGEIPVPSEYDLPSTVYAYNLPDNTWVSLWGKYIYAPRDPDNPVHPTVPYRVFVPLSVVSESNDTFGLRIYNSNAELVFDSGRPTFNVASNHLFMGGSTSDGGDLAYNNPNKKWTIISTAGIRLLIPNGSAAGLSLCTYLMQNSSGDVHSKLAVIGHAPRPMDVSSIGGIATCSSILIDIT
jgi:hypothetical protein